MWIGDDQSVASTVGDDGRPSSITDPGALMDDPPDILLTNYKMLDRLLTTPSGSGCGRRTRRRIRAAAGSSR